MNMNLKYFLIAAEEQSISKAAKRIFITQQSLSDHIRRLEESYGVKLFERKPHLTLTPAGEVLAHRLRQIQNIESALVAELQEVQQGMRGHLCIGMHSTRAKIILPQLLREYRKLFPDVYLSVFHDEAGNLEKMLLAGDLDLFLGINVTPLPEFHTIPLMESQTYLVISKNLINQFFPAGFFPQQQIDLSHFSHVPFIMSHPISRLYRLVQHFCEEQGIRLNTVLTISDADTHALLAAQDCGACFCTQLMLGRIAQVSRQQEEDNPLYCFSIAGLTQTSRFELVYPKGSYLPRYTQTFIELMQQQFDQYRQWQPEPLGLSM